MSRADEIFIRNCKDILENGTWDTDREVRPRWEDGTPAHTIKKLTTLRLLSVSGFSHLDIVAWHSPAFCASSACVKPSSSRRVFML